MARSYYRYPGNYLRNYGKEDTGKRGDGNGRIRMLPYRNNSLPDFLHRMHRMCGRNLSTCIIQSVQSTEYKSISEGMFYIPSAV